MEAGPTSRVREEAVPDAIQRAIDYGIDISLLEEMLLLSPAERMRRHDEAVIEILELRKKIAKD
jgi:hypothetical protein